MIGTPEAQYITNKESGVGFLRVGMEDPVKFHSVFTGVNYVPTAVAGRHRRGGPEACRPGPAADPSVHRGADCRAGDFGSRVMSTESEQRVLREVVLEQLTTGDIRAYRMWLPPLTDPTPVNELVERDRRQPLALRDGHHGRAAQAPPGGVGRRRLGGGRQHRHRRCPADRQVDVPADDDPVGRPRRTPRARCSSTASTSAAAA